ncbi:MAG: LuxR C-terminal-related transcriptional regulator [Chromatiales bacterium]|nr:LuxR C-terminal-related transcriptional regulator [Chromatiales bacterium]
MIFLTGHADLADRRAGDEGRRRGLPDQAGRARGAARRARARARRATPAPARSRGAEADTAGAASPQLTPREREVFELVVAGQLNKQIADELGIAERTVKLQRAQLMAEAGRELGGRTRPAGQAVAPPGRLIAASTCSNLIQGRSTSPRDIELSGSAIRWVEEILDRMLVKLPTFGMARNTRPISWIKAARKDFDIFPESAQLEIERALTVAAEGGKADIAKPMKGLGSGVFEIASLTGETPIGPSTPSSSTPISG